MNEQTRLRQYLRFRPEVLDTVASVAEHQRSQTWQDISSHLPEVSIFRSHNNKPVEVLDIEPYDYDDVLVYHLPMGVTLDASMSMRLSALSLAEPYKRLISFSNPGSPGRGKGKIKTRDMLSVYNGDLRLTLDSPLRYLAKQGIEEVVHIGYSYGAEKAIAAAKYSDLYGQKVDQTICMEPVAIKDRHLISLGLDFLKTSTSLDEYVEAADCKAYDEARKIADKQGHGTLGYIFGLAKLSNLAIGNCLKRDIFEANVYEAIKKQQDMQLNIYWGSDSELSTDKDMMELFKRLNKFNHKRIHAEVMAKQKHAMGEDIYLHTAMILQALRRH